MGTAFSVPRRHLLSESLHRFRAAWTERAVPIFRPVHTERSGPLPAKVDPKMLLQILRFETRYWFRGIMLWVFFVIITALFLAATSSDKLTIGGALENTNRNAPFVIQNYYGMAGILTLLMTTAFVNAAAARDFAYNTAQMVFSTPLKRSDFLLGRFFGAAIVSTIPILGVSVGILLARYMPWADADRFGPIYWSAHIKSILTLGIPNTLFVAAIIFAVAALTRSTITSFIAALVLLVGYAVSDAFLSDLRNETIAAITDPFSPGPASP